MSRMFPSPICENYLFNKQGFRIQVELQSFHTVDELKEILPDCSDELIRSHIKMLEHHFSNLCCKEEQDGKFRFVPRTDLTAEDHTSGGRSPGYDRKWSDDGFEAAICIPEGNINPPPLVTTFSGFARDPLVKAWVLLNARGTCEGCGCRAPFTTPSGEDFLEVHHVRLLSEHGTDTTTNAVALCPNCHRRSHYSWDRTDFTDALYLKVPRLNRE